MEDTRMKQDREKLDNLLDGFDDAYARYLNNLTPEEFDRVVEERVGKRQCLIEYLIKNGMTFQRTGHWICGYDDQDSWTCSECGFPVMTADDDCDPYEAEIDYCEKCGARMIKPKKGR